MQEEKNTEAVQTPEETAAPVQETAPEQTPDREPVKEGTVEPGELEKTAAELAEQKNAYLRLAAEYDNFRKRSQKEKDRIYADAQADTTAKFLGIFDNLERAVAQETTDEAYKKGVVMIMNSYMDTLKKLGVEQFGEAGEAFDPNLHNAVMHEENEALGENVISQVFQRGFRLGDRTIRPAMVKVAN